MSRKEKCLLLINKLLSNLENRTILSFADPWFRTEAMIVINEQWYPHHIAIIK